MQIKGVKCGMIKNRGTENCWDEVIQDQFIINFPQFFYSQFWPSPLLLNYVPYHSLINEIMNVIIIAVSFPLLGASSTVKVWEPCERWLDNCCSPNTFLLHSVLDWNCTLCSINIVHITDCSLRHLLLLHIVLYRHYTYHR